MDAPIKSMGYSFDGAYVCASSDESTNIEIVCGLKSLPRHISADECFCRPIVILETTSTPYKQIILYLISPGILTSTF